MDNQDFQDLYDAEGLYEDLQSNLESFYENFEALGQDLTKSIKISIDLSSVRQ